jgi:lipopolysaccharide transport system permease protein
MREWMWVANPVAVVEHFRRHRYLLAQLARREVQMRYHGSWLGPLWSLLTPLLMLSVYTFVFSVVFPSRWGTDVTGGRLDVALALFASLTTFGLFSETVCTAPHLILGNRNYVKRVVFPLEVLPLARLLSNLVQTSLGFAVFLVALLLVRGGLPWTVVWLPIVLLPLCLLTLGCAFFLASLGVFIRDVGQVIGLAVTMLMFLSSVFYPISSVPARWQWAMRINPVATVIEEVRRVTLDGQAPHWPAFGLLTLLGGTTMAVGLVWFLRSKNAFADVL